MASFNLQFAQYRLAPEATRTRLYLETLAEALPSAGQKIVVDEGLRQLLPVLPLQPLQPLQPQQAQPSGSGKKQEVR